MIHDKRLLPPTLLRASILLSAALLCHFRSDAQLPDDGSSEPVPSILGFRSAHDSTHVKEKYKVRISGVLQIHSEQEFNTNGDSLHDPPGFRVLRARLIAKGRINKFTTYELMIDPRAPEQGGIMRDAFVAFALGKHQSLRVGQQKTMFGYENAVSITELYTVNRSDFCDAAMRGVNLRDIGLGLLGEIPLTHQMRIENAVTFTNGSRSTVAGPFDFNTRKALWGRVGLRYKENGLEVRLGGSIATGGLRYLGDSLLIPTDDVYAAMDRVGADLEIEHKWFHLSGEFARGSDTVADTLYQEPKGYAVIAALKTKWNAGPLFRYEEQGLDFKMTTFGLYYGKPKDALRVLVNYEVRGNITDVPQGHDDRLYIQLQLVF